MRLRTARYIHELLADDYAECLKIFGNDKIGEAGDRLQKTGKPSDMIKSEKLQAAYSSLLNYPQRGDTWGDLDLAKYDIR